MATIKLPLANGTFTRRADVGARGGSKAGHQMHVECTESVTGSLTIKARAPGSTVYEAIPDGTFNLAEPKTIQFTFICDSYELTLANVVGTGELVITDLVAEV